MISYEELAAENARLLGIIKALKAENAVLRSMLQLPTRSNEPEPKPKHLDREAIITQRLSLFRSLFRGREDVYDKRWVSKDVLSYVAVCREWGIQPCVERSRFGKGVPVTTPPTASNSTAQEECSTTP